MKKVLSFVLILALVLSSFSMAFAASGTELTTLSDISGNTNEEAIEVNYDLGIVTGNPDGTFQPEKAVTRAEFAAMITRALAIPDSALAAYSSTSFSDTAGYGWAVPYLAFCNSKGIMLGDGAGRAMPGQTITVNEAVTMVLRAIGYTANSAELTGVWPSNYVTKAQELKLYDDVAKDATGVDKANAAQIIYNALAVQKVAVNSDGKTEKLWVDGDSTNTAEDNKVTLLSSGLNCKAEVGIVGCGDIDIDESLINIAKHIGKYGTVYTNDDDEIVAFISDSDQLTGRFYTNSSGDFKFIATDGGAEYNIASSVTVTAVSTNNGENGTSNGAVVSTAFAGENATGNWYDGNEYTLSVDLSGKTIKHVYSAVNWNTTTADQVDATDVSQIADDQSLLGEDFVLDNNDEIDYTQFQLVGINKLSDLKADHVVYVYADSDGIRKLEVGTETVEGTVKSFKNAKDATATTFAIGSNTYKNAGQVINNLEGNGNSNVTIDDVSDDIKAFLDARGYVYDFENTTRADNYAVVEKYSGAGINDQAKLMIADGSEKTFEFDLDGAVTNSIGATFGTSPYNLIGYGLNKDGEISEVNTNAAFITTVGGASATLSSVNVIRWDAAGPGGAGSAKISSDVVVFTYDGTDYDVTTIDKVETNENLLGESYGLTLLFDDGDGYGNYDEVVAMIVDDGLAKGGKASYAVFNETNKTSNDDGDTVWEVVGFMDGARLNTLTDDENGIFSTASGKTSGVVDPGYSGTTLTAQVYKVKVDADGLITSADLVTNGFVGSKADGDVSEVTGLVVDSVDSRKSIKATSGVTYALSPDVAVYQVNSDNEYRLYSGSLKKNDCFTVYNMDTDDNDEIDVVVFHRP